MELTDTHSGKSNTVMEHFEINHQMQYAKIMCQTLFSGTMPVTMPVTRQYDSGYVEIFFTNTDVTGGKDSLPALYKA